MPVEDQLGINPYAMGHAVGARFRQQGGNMAQAIVDRMNAIDAEEMKRLEMDQNMKLEMIKNAQHLGGLFGSQGYARLLPEFRALGPVATDPSGFVQQRDVNALNEMQTGALKEIAGGMKDAAEAGQRIIPSDQMQDATGIRTEPMPSTSEKATKPVGKKRFFKDGVEYTYDIPAEQAPSADVMMNLRDLGVPAMSEEEFNNFQPSGQATPKAPMTPMQIQKERDLVTTIEKRGGKIIDRKPMPDGSTEYVYQVPGAPDRSIIIDKSGRAISR